MKKSNVYTRSGDKGTTSLVSGNRLEKSDLRIDLYGDVDELNAALGHGVSLLKETSNTTSIDLSLITEIQSALFDLGSRLACEEEFWTKFKLPDVSADLTVKMEKEIDKMDSVLPTMKSFILPGGNKAASYFHVVRTICRRVERKLVAFNISGGKLPDHALEFINRSSDFYFVLSRYINHESGCDEVKWIPQKS